MKNTTYVDYLVDLENTSEHGREVLVGRNLPCSVRER
jgi:hypothetical protein